MANPSSKSASGAVEKVVESLGVDPCLLAIVIVVVVAGLLIWQTYQHQERMEKLRLEQFSELLKKVKTK